MTDITIELLDELESVANNHQKFTALIARERAKLRPKWVCPKRRLIAYKPKDFIDNTLLAEDDDHYQLRILKSLWVFYGEGWEFTDGKSNASPFFDSDIDEFGQNIWTHSINPCAFHYEKWVPQEVLAHLNELKELFGYET